MTKAKKLLFVVAIFSVLALAGAGCGGGGGTTTNTSSGNGTPATNTNAQGGTQNNELSQILGLSKDVTNYSYDQKIDSTGQLISSVIYRKDQKMRQDTSAAGQQASMYLDMATGEIYSYMPATKMAFKLSSGESQNNEPIDKVAGDINPGTKILGTEKVNGEDCVIVQVTVDNSVEKVWLSKKYGLPMKMEVQTPEGTITTEITNLKIGGVTDADVTLPSDAKITTLPGMGQ